MDFPLTSVQDFLYARIPLSRALNVTVESATDKSLTLRAPRFANTVDGSKLSSLCMLNLCELASWAFLHISLQRLDFAPCTQLHAANYTQQRELDPETPFVRATCKVPSDKDWQQFLRQLSRKKRGSIDLTSELDDGGSTAAQLTGSYETRDLSH